MANYNPKLVDLGINAQGKLGLRRREGRRGIKRASHTKTLVFVDKMRKRNNKKNYEYFMRHQSSIFIFLCRRKNALFF